MQSKLVKMPLSKYSLDRNKGWFVTSASQTGGSNSHAVYFCIRFNHEPKYTSMD